MLKRDACPPSRAVVSPRCHASPASRAGRGPARRQARYQLVKFRVRLALWQLFCDELRLFIVNVPVAVTACPFPFGTCWLATTSGIQKFAVFVSEAPVSTVSHVVISVPLLLQAAPVQLSPAGHALTVARWMVPTCWWPGDGLSTVNDTVEDVPG